MAGSSTWLRWAEDHNQGRAVEASTRLGMCRMDADGYIILVISQTSIAVRGYDKTQIARD
jgi:hypothetical protein